MSEYFTGVTFPWQKVTPSDDAIVRRKLLDDGVLSGCDLSYSGSTLTMAAGWMIACGRMFRHAAAQNWAVVDATSGYARLLLTIDTTKASTKDAFDQIVDSIEYASSPDGFPALQQTDINQAGTVYQVVVCVVSLGTGGISGIYSQIGQSAIPSAPEYTATIPTSNWSAYGDAYINTLYISGILATDNPFVDVLLTSGDTATQAADMKICEEWGKVFRITVSDGLICVLATEIPEVAIPIRLKVVR